MIDVPRPRRLSAGALALLALSACAGGGWREPAASPAAIAPPQPSPNVDVAELKTVVRDGDLENAFGDDALAGGAVREEDTPQVRAKMAPASIPAKGRPPPPPPPNGTPANGTPANGTPATTRPAREPAAITRRESLLIYTATLTLAVFQVEASLNRIEELTRGVGGYLASRNDASIVVRVPRARFQEALAEIEKVGDVLHRNVEAQDVSDQVVDLEARLKNARAVRDRLAQLLQGATATKDALAIEKELARVMGEIEQMEGKLQLLSDKVAYSTVTVTFQPLRTNDVHTTARLPFPWLEGLGLGPLLQVK